MSFHEASSRTHGVLLFVGFVPAAVLLGRLSYDLGALGWPLAIAMTVFFGGFVFLGAGNALAAFRRHVAEPLPGRAGRWALFLAVPVALLGSVLDCMGLAFVGCSTTCTLLMDVLGPLVVVLGVLYLATGRPGLLTSMSAASLVFLVPNCVCYNPVNGPWIDLLGRSPACFAGSFGVTLVVLGALRTGRFVVPALGFVWCANAAMLSFFVGHHFFDYPW